MFVGWKWTSSQKEIIICMVRVSLQSYCPLDGSAPIQCEIEAAFSWKSCLSPAWLFSSKKRFLYLWCELIWGFYLIQVYNYITQLYVEYQSLPMTLYHLLFEDYQQNAYFPSFLVQLTPAWRSNSTLARPATGVGLLQTATWPHLQKERMKNI